MRKLILIRICQAVMIATVLSAFLLAGNAGAWVRTGTRVSDFGWYPRAGGYGDSTTEYVTSPGMYIYVNANVCTTPYCSGDPGGLVMDVPETDEMWVQLSFMYPYNFPFHPVANKLVYFVNVATNQYAWIIDGPSPGLSPAESWIRPSLSDGQFHNLPPNVTTTSVTAGNWYKVKMYANRSTGVFKMWVNDVLNCSYTNEFPSQTFSRIILTPVWGGQGATGPSIDAYTYYDDIYVSNDTEPGGSTSVDQTSPYVDQLSPAEGSTGNDNTVRTISLHVKDGVAVTRNSIILNVSVNGGAETSYFYGSGLTVSPSATTSSDFTITRTMSADYPAGATVVARVTASDNAATPNTMTKSYTFTTAYGVSPGPSGNRAQILTYLQGLPAQPSKKVLSGQFIGWCGEIDAGLFGRINTAGGHYPGLMSANYAAWGGCDVAANIISGPNSYLKTHWAAGGLVEVGWHPFNPQNNSWNNDPTTVSLVDIVTAGTTANTNWKAMMDVVATGLQDLKDNGVVVIFRPFVEMNGNWFWWGNRDATQFKTMWIYTYNYLVNTKGLTNLIWAYSTGSVYQNDLGYYPGSSYVDIAGFDYYEDASGQVNGRISSVPDYATLQSSGKPFALMELGLCSGSASSCPSYDAATMLSDIKANYPNTIWWSNWNQWWALDQYYNLNRLMADPWVVNRDDNPVGKATAQALSVYTTSLPAGQVGVAQSMTLTAVGGRGPYSWSLLSGSLSPGYSLSLGGGISTPSATGAGDATASFIIRVTDNAAATSDQALTHYVAPATPTEVYTITASSIAATWIGSSAPTTNHSADNAVKVYQYPAGNVANRGFDNVSFSLPSNAVIQSATWEGTLASLEGSGGTSPMRIHLSPADNVPIGTVTWSNFGGTLGAEVAVISVGTTIGTKYTADITSIVRAAFLASQSSFLVGFDGGADGASSTNRTLNMQGVTITYSLSDTVIPTPNSPGHMTIFGAMNF